MPRSWRMREAWDQVLGWRRPKRCDQIQQVISTWTLGLWRKSPGPAASNLEPCALENITRTSGIQPGTLCSREYHQDQRHSTWTLGLWRISPGQAASNLEPRTWENITRTSSNPWMESEGQMTVVILPLLFSWFRGRGVVSCLWRSMPLFIGKTLYKVIVGVAFCDSWLPHWPGRKLFCTHNFYHCFKVLQDFIFKETVSSGAPGRAETIEIHSYPVSGTCPAQVSAR